jgi:hypothetical protein
LVIDIQDLVNLIKIEVMLSSPKSSPFEVGAINSSSNYSKHFYKSPL